MKDWKKFSALANGWNEIRLKYAVALSNARTDDRSNGLAYVGLEQIESGTGRLVTSGEQPSRQEIETENGSSTANLFNKGDVLFCKLRPYLAKAFIAESSGAATTELLVFKPSSMLYRRYLLYVLLSSGFINLVDSSTFGSKMPRADWDFIGNVPILIPPPTEQRAIADMLDRETARLDELIAEKGRLLESLAEKRQALITRAVTRGLNPDALLRHSGSEWLGEVPAHWEMRRLATLFRERDERGEADLPLLNVSLNTGVTEREFEEDRIERVAADFNTYKVARRGDIAFNKMRMWQGAVGVAPVAGLVSPDYTVTYPIYPLNIYYIEALFRAPIMSAEFARHSHGIHWDRLRLYWDGFREIYVPLPSIEEQKKIVAAVEKEVKNLDALRSETQRTIDLLRERRSALVAAAVTGQLAVHATQ